MTRSTLTFLFTDIEGSTRRWESAAPQMAQALARHDTVLRSAIAAQNGQAFKHTGDGLVAAFPSAEQAVLAAIDAQRALELPVRMALATGEVEARDGDYFGPALNHAARILGAGHGGQILLAPSTAALVDAVELIDLIDLGEHRLRDLARALRLFQVHAEGLKRDFPPLRSLNAALGNLPARTTALLGRDAALAEIEALVLQTRLVTLTGVGGVGKTRLALEAGDQLSASFADGVRLVELGAIGEASAIEHAMAAALNVTQQPGQSLEQSILAALAFHRLLIVIDNCEHLIEPVAALVRAILAHCPSIALLATSREPLAIEAERVWPVPTLSLREGTQSAAVQLFVERARTVRHDFELGADAEAVTEICRRLDGIPLAIELAAARIRSLSPTQIRDRLDERFRLLGGGTRRSLQRHQTLHQAVQWSFDLLNPAERCVLARVSVFAGSFALAAAEHLCTGDTVAALDVIDLLDSLVGKSLLVAERAGAEIRYRLLETIREFAMQHLVAAGEADVYRKRHAELFAAAADAQFAIWRSAAQLAAYLWLDLELDNLREAFRWSVERGAIDLAARIAAGIGDMARFRLRYEPSDWAAEIVDAARTAGHPRLVILLTWAASSAWGKGEVDAARRFSDDAIALAGDTRFDAFAWAFTDRAMVAMFDGDSDATIALAQQGAALAADATDRFCAAITLYLLAATGRYAQVLEQADAIVAAVRQTGVPYSDIIAHIGLARAQMESAPAQALAALNHALAQAQGSGNLFWETLAASDLAALHARSGDAEPGLRRFLALVETWRRSADRMFVLHGLGSLVILFERLDRPEPAVLLHGVALDWANSSPFAGEMSAAMARLKQRLGQAAFDALQARGAKMSLHEATAYAQAEIEHALAASA